MDDCALVPGGREYLSEDWALSRRAEMAGVDRFIYAKPTLRHHGDHAYTVEELAVPQ